MRAYSRPTSHSTIEHCHFFQKSHKDFDAKHLEKGLNRGGGENVGAYFFKKSPFIIKNCLF